MSANQAKFAYKLILFTNTFFRLVDNYEEKTDACHPIGRVINEVVKR